MGYIGSDSGVSYCHIRYPEVGHMRGVLTGNMLMMIIMIGLALLLAVALTYGVTWILNLIGFL